MAGNLAAYRTLIKAWLATTTDPATWTDAIIDEGLRHALMEFSAAAPPAEATVTVGTAGRAQDLAALTDLDEIAAIGWPWNDGDQVFIPCRWRRVGATGVIVESGIPAAGDKMRVRCWRRCAVQGLDGATATTVPDAREHLVVVGAAGHTLLLRVRQVAEHPAVPAAAAAVLQAVAAAWLAQYRAGLARMVVGSGVIAWGDVGL